MGGGGGYQQSEATSEPWKQLQPYLTSLFNTVYSGAYNKQIEYDKDGNFKGWKDPSEGMIDAFTGEDAVGKLEYFGDTRNALDRYFYGGWEDKDQINLKDPYNADGSLKLDYTPTLAPFSPEQELAQNIIKARAKGAKTYTAPDGSSYSTGYSPVIGTSKTALDDILSGRNQIDPASMEAAQIGNIDTIAKPVVNTPDSMNTTNVGSTDLGYKYWDELGQITGNKQNPYLEKMIENAKENLRNEYTNYQIPSLDTTAERAGAYGSGQWGKLRNDAWNTYLDKIGDVEQSMRGSAYESNMNRALQGLNLGGELAKSQSGMDAERNIQQALLDYNRGATQYGTDAEAKRLQAQLGLQADTSNVGNMLEKASQNAQLQQGANQTNAGYQQQANMQNVQNILQGVPIAGDVSQADYNDVSNLAAVGEERSGQWQKILDEYKNRFETKQMEPWNRAGMASNLFAGNWGGTTTSSGKSGK